MRLIDPDALRRAVCEFVQEKDDYVPCTNQITSCLWSSVRVCDFNRIIDNQPTIEAEPKWIPISEKTPGAEHVLVTLKWGEDDYEVTELDYAADVACGGRIAQHVTAWMPLPESYKEGQAHGDVCEKSTADIVTVKIPIVAMGDGEGGRVQLLCDISKASYEDALYPCDPSKNTECRKTGCFKNGGPCSSTRHAEYAAGGVAKKGV